ncbi:hypothetical protein HMPREF9444_00946 [Succinatimonas hippei YIT 12066]|uniref:Uncharacterized protein n=1 Tax=Succinatimonas hippei (strain DSM 22608 / JCM 16073 / KCTC 15190 / YIT 12066) TaxID=762983 RepID=E8LJR3_SUCHY|nr:hypothetical protein HMPREF9444_00946 [Succinatimonas hippei YIT 12066]
MKQVYELILEKFWRILERDDKNMFFIKIAVFYCPVVIFADSFCNG